MSINRDFTIYVSFFSVISCYANRGFPYKVFIKILIFIMGKCIIINYCFPMILPYKKIPALADADKRTA